MTFFEADFFSSDDNRTRRIPKTTGLTESARAAPTRMGKLRGMIEKMIVKILLTIRLLEYAKNLNYQ